jgi:hypothetical protein
MRSFGVGKDEEGTTRLLLNGEPYFFNGVLDQGYWPESLMTPPADEALVYDIEQMKALGFNMLRKHVKIELSKRNVNDPSHNCMTFIYMILLPPARLFLNIILTLR